MESEKCVTVHVLMNDDWQIELQLTPSKDWLHVSQYCMYEENEVLWYSEVHNGTSWFLVWVFSTNSDLQAVFPKFNSKK